MIDRCDNPRARAYPTYGAKGIRVEDPRWYDFLTFLSDMGVKPSPDYSIDRIDNAHGYRLSNCRWATRVEQAQNKRISARRAGSRPGAVR